MAASAAMAPSDVAVTSWWRDLARVSYSGYYVSFPRMRSGSDSLYPHHIADVAQLAEQLIRNEQVTGSIPAIGSIFCGIMNL